MGPRAKQPMIGVIPDDMMPILNGWSDVIAVPKATVLDDTNKLPTVRNMQ